MRAFIGERHMSVRPAAALPYEPPQSHLEDAASDLENTRSAIAARLRRVCTGMPAEEFDQLIEHMARLQTKYVAREHQQ
jgi:hypothetical protein